jgi:hypothetical protein
LSGRIHAPFIATFKLPFKFSPEYPVCPEHAFGQTGVSGRPGVVTDRSRRKERESVMGESDITVPTGAEDCFALGMMHSAGAGIPVDLVQAHKWFNIAAARGHREAAQLRREVAEQMTDSEIGQAQRAARAWLQAHPIAPAKREMIAA